MKTLMIPFRETYETPEQRDLIRYSASSRIRCDYVANYWQDADVFDKETWKIYFKEGKISGKIFEYEAYIFQKAFTPFYYELASALKQAGKAVIFDLCDAEWDKPERRDSLEKMIRLSDLVTTSTEYIRDYVSKNYHRPAVRIPDRLDLDDFPRVKAHRNGGKPRVCWFGNRNTIYQLLSMNDALWMANKEIPFTLVLISDRFDGYNPTSGDFPEIEKREWRLQTANDDILSCDVVVNPHDLYTETGRAKSDNKTITAWALGMPVVSHGNTHRIQTLLVNYLRRDTLRAEVGAIGRRMVEQLFDSRISALEYQYAVKEVLCSMQAN